MVNPRQLSQCLSAGFYSNVEMQLGNFNLAKPCVQKEGKDSAFLRDVIFGSHDHVYDQTLF